MQKYKDRIAELEKVLENLLEELRYWNNGCGCCGNQTAYENDEFKTAENILHKEW